ncbi:hypothetical protein ABI011_14955, partial [Enterococcus faecium]|uniref:hypothetical protein n=1 Tax=Enterococcus faecium TaxID=1352 RepID=UPI003F43F95F
PEEQFRKALAVCQKLVAEAPANPVFMQGLAKAHAYLGAVLVGLGKRAEAEEHATTALNLLEQLRGNTPADPDQRGEWAFCHTTV